MQVNNINNKIDGTGFQAKKIAVITSKLSKNNTKDVVEIYSLSKRDSEFAKNYLDKLNKNSITIENDPYGVYYHDPKKSVALFFQNIITPMFKQFEHPLVAIKNNSEICGFATFFNIHDITRLKDFIVLKDSKNKQVRKGLIYSIMEKSKNNDAFVLAPSGWQERTSNFFKSIGIPTQKNTGGFKVIETPELIKDYINNMRKNNKTLDFHAVNDKKEYNLQEILNKQA